jgi:polysaccharide export outer membrane protein
MNTALPSPTNLELAEHRHSPSGRRKVAAAASLALLGSVLLGFSGCQSSQPTPFTPEDRAPETSMKLSEGDLVRIVFPGATNLNMLQQIRRDGKMSLPLVGEVTAAGLTPDELEKEVLRLYEPQLLQKEVRVALDSSAYPVYVNGAVLRPGKIMLDRPMTALEAISEAGINHARANLKRVSVTRREGATLKHYELNLKAVQEGKSQTPFYLKPADVIFIPEKAI